MSDPDEPRLLASDAEREQRVSQLREATVEGRLTLEEFTERVGQAQVARTQQELALLVRDLPQAALVVHPADEQVRHLALCSRLERRGVWELPRSSSFRSIFGTIVLDLRQATLAGPESVVDVFNFFGTVTVIVPEGIATAVEGGGALASQVIEPAASRPIRDAPRLRIRASGPGGTLHVLNREPQSRLRRMLGSG